MIDKELNIIALKEAVANNDWETVTKLSEMLETHDKLDRTTSVWSPGMARAIFKRDDGYCVYCGRLAIEIDHVVPTSWGGPTMKNNGVCTCHRCNCIKSNRLKVDMITQGIFWLMQCGEDMSWVDTFKPL
jgi:hypothetical protein